MPRRPRRRRRPRKLNGYSAKKPTNSRYIKPTYERKLGVCTWCGGYVSSPKRYWCSEECIREHSIRSSGTVARYEVFKRDNGVCAACGVDTVQVQKELDLCYIRKHKEVRKALEGQFPSQKALSVEADKEMRRFIKEVMLTTGWDMKRKSQWDADHIIPVSEGGGGCGLSNYQTLCIRCHKIKTHKR